jgi:hypothetical protein
VKEAYIPLLIAHQKQSRVKVALKKCKAKGSCVNKFIKIKKDLVNLPKKRKQIHAQFAWKKLIGKSWQQLIVALTNFVSIVYIAGQQCQVILVQTARKRLIKSLIKAF